MNEGQTILIADDEAPIRQMVAMKLRGAGFAVLEARDGEEALEIATATPPAMVVTDLQMPWINGLELCVRLKAQESTSRVPVLMLTARGHLLASVDIARTNIREVISKPFSARQVLQAVESILGQSKGAGTPGASKGGSAHADAA